MKNGLLEKAHLKWIYIIYFKFLILQKEESPSWMQSGVGMAVLGRGRV